MKKPKSDPLRDALMGRLSCMPVRDKEKVARIVGVSTSTLYRYSKTPANFKLWQIRKLLDALGVEADSPARRIG